jgi:hypothetical protein
MRHLHELQRVFLRGITRAHVPGAGSGPPLALLSEIQGDDRLGAAERVEIYARMYCARLVDVLAEDYPRVAVILGADVFGDLAHAYVEAHPSTHPSLRWFGRGFADFLAGSTERGLPGFVGDLARLEWARLSVFDAADAEVLAIDTLRRLPADDWASLRLRLTPAVEVLHVAWPVHRIWEVGEAGAVGDREPSETWMRVWRQSDKVYQASMDDAERTALAHVQVGDTFAELCNGVGTVVGPEAAAATAGALVLRWIEDGLLREGESFR